MDWDGTEAKRNQWLMLTHHRLHTYYMRLCNQCKTNITSKIIWTITDINDHEDSYDIGIDTKIEVIVVSPMTWEAHHSPRAKPEGCGELPRSLVTPQWPKSRYQFRFYHDAPKYIKFMQIRVCISRKSFIKPLQISHYGKHGHRPLSQQLP